MFVLLALAAVAFLVPGVLPTTGIVLLLQRQPDPMPVDVQEWGDGFSAEPTLTECRYTSTAAPIRMEPICADLDSLLPPSHIERATGKSSR